MSKAFIKPSASIPSAIAEVCVSHPVSKDDPVNQPLANEKARKGAGAALADLLVTETQKQAIGMKHFVVSLIALDSDGRKGFQEYLTDILKQRREYAKGVLNPVVKGTAESAAVRLSEFNTLAKAVNKGFVPDMEEGYHVIVAGARHFLRTIGEGDKRGAKKTHAIVKLLKTLEKMEGVDAADTEAITQVYNLAAELAISMGLAVEKDGE